MQKKGGGYKMNTDTVLFLEEVLKYLITMGCIVYNDYERAKESLPSFDKHRRGRNPFGYLAEVLQVTPPSVRAFAVYGLPAFLYAIQGVLFWQTLKYMDPSTYQVTNNAKLIMTGVMQHTILGRKLTPRKQQALAMLAGGILVGQWNGKTMGKLLALPIHAYVLSLTTSFTASLANISLDYFYKKRAVGQFHQSNMWLYGYGVFFRLLGLLWGVGGLTGLGGMMEGFDAVVFTMLMFSTIGHIFTAAVIKFHSPLTKSFCTATAIPVTALLSYAIFHKKQSVQFILGMPIVCLAVLMYSTLPGGQGPFSFTIPRPATPK